MCEMTRIHVDTYVESRKSKSKTKQLQTSYKTAEVVNTLPFFSSFNRDKSLVLSCPLVQIIRGILARTEEMTTTDVQPRYQWITTSRTTKSPQSLHPTL